MEQLFDRWISRHAFHGTKAAGLAAINSTEVGARADDPFFAGRKIEEQQGYGRRWTFPVRYYDTTSTIPSSLTKLSDWRCVVYPFRGVMLALGVVTAALVISTYAVAADLGAPSVLGPVSQCSDEVVVKGILNGATVRVFRNGEISKPVAESVGSAPTMVLHLTHLPAGGLLSGDKLTAMQTRDAQVSLVSSKPVEVQKFDPAFLKVANLASLPPHICAQCLLFNGLVPGAALKIRPGSNTETSLRSILDYAHGGLDPALNRDEALPFLESACQVTGTILSGPTPEQPEMDQARRLPALVFTRKMYACDATVPVGGVQEGALVSVSRASDHGQKPVQACFPASRWPFWVRPLEEGENITATQGFAGCYDIVESPAVGEKVLPASEAPAPVVAPLCEGPSVKVSGLSPGAEYRLWINRTQPITCAAEAEISTCDVGSPLARGATVTAQQMRCGVWGPMSAEVIVDKGPAKVPLIGSVGPLTECSTVVRVTGTYRGAILMVYSKKLGPISSPTYAAGEEDLIQVGPALLAGDEILVEETVCQNKPVRTAPATVNSAPGLGHPMVVKPVWAGQSEVTVNDVVPGATVELFVNAKSATAVKSGSTQVVMHLANPIKLGDQFKVRQSFCNKVTPLAPEPDAVAMAPKPPGATNLSPIGGGQPRNVTLSWSDPGAGGSQAATSFDVSSNVNGSTNNVETTSTNYPLSGLPYSANVYWCVISKNQWGSGSSSCASFTVEKEPPPPPPAPVGINGAYYFFNVGTNPSDVKLTLTGTVNPGTGSGPGKTSLMETFTCAVIPGSGGSPAVKSSCAFKVSDLQKGTWTLTANSNYAAPVTCPKVVVPSFLVAINATGEGTKCP